MIVLCAMISIAVMEREMKRVEMIEEYLHDENGGDYIWHDNHGILVRCKDCKHYDGRPCGIVDWWNAENDYCSRAERRKDG